MKGILRFFVFLVAISAVLALLAGGGLFLLTQLQPVQSSGETWLSDTDLSPSSVERMIIGLYLRFRQQDIDRPASADDAAVPFVVEQGETAVTIANRLFEEGIITDPDLFRLYIRYHEIDARLEAGNFDLRRNMTMEELAEALQHARMEEISVTIVPGWRIEETAEMLERENIVSADAFLALARQGTFAYAALADRPEGSTLEGYLYPETYRLPAQATALDLVERMLKTFDERLTPEVRQAIERQGLTVYQAVTVASIVQREGVVAEELPIIADVYLNRIEQGMPLQADPTFQYARGYDPISDKWWAPFQVEDVEKVQSPYNTFLNYGLPPGPICSPGQAALEAVAFPADTNYLFFYAKGDGTHAFATTYEEHLQNQARYGG
ncbi:MAG: endolytic transglycosylase MltG [Chloroflexota bacterium]